MPFIPRRKKNSPDLSRYPQGGTCHGQACDACMAICPTNAITKEGVSIQINDERCILCGCCIEFCPAHTFSWVAGNFPYRQQGINKKIFSPVLYLLPFDAGDCGFCLEELNQIFYCRTNGAIEITRHAEEADVLLVVGAVPPHLQEDLMLACANLKEPKIIVASGVCALSGGVFIHEAKGLPFKADLIIPGCPPNGEIIFKALSSLIASNHDE